MNREHGKRIDRLQREIRQVAGDETVFSTTHSCPPGTEEQFLNSILAFELAEERPLLDILHDKQLVMPPPANLSDEALSMKLWEVIRALAAMRVFLCSTDHLSDRQLYTKLLVECLPEPTKIMPPESKYNCHIDLIGSGSPEDIQAYLTYYANKRDRREFAKEWPDTLIPSRRKPAFKRDHLLPKPE